MNTLLYTNNPRLRNRVDLAVEVCYQQIGLLDLFLCIRDQVHQGGQLLTHPLSGSVKPNENPYKSVLLQTGHQALHMQSLELIEQAIATVKKFEQMPIGRVNQEEYLADFALIDESLILSSLGK